MILATDPSNLSAKPAEIVGLRMRGPANALSTVRRGLVLVSTHFNNELHA